MDEHLLNEIENWLNYMPATRPLTPAQLVMEVSAEFDLSLDEAVEVLRQIKARRSPDKLIW